jgi:hypothetical protein
MQAAVLPQPGADYPLVLGQTLRDQPADLCYMRYDFKPASVARQGEGSMSIAGSEVGTMHACMPQHTAAVMPSNQIS